MFMKKVAEIAILIGLFLCILISTVFIARCIEQKNDYRDFSETFQAYIAV